MAHWHAVIQNGMRSFPEVCADIFESGEASEQALNYSGRVGSENDVVSAIDRLYRVGLGRPASETDVSAWKRALQQGNLSLSAVVSAILTSPEAETWQASRRVQDADLDAPSSEENGFLQRLIEEHVDALALFHGRLHGSQPTSEMVAAWRDDLHLHPTKAPHLITQMLDRAPLAEFARDLTHDNGLSAIGSRELSAAKMVRTIASLPEPLANPRLRRARADDSKTIGEAVKHLYKLALNRIARPDEIDHWVRVVEENKITVSELVCSIATSAEAVEKERIAPDLSDGVFIQVLYELILQRGASADEIAIWQHSFTTGEIDRRAMLRSLFQANASSSAKGETATQNDVTHTYLLGTERVVTLADWEQASVNDVAAKTAESKQFTRYHIVSSPRVLVSAIASLYRGEAFIERFLQNITAQTIFREYAELIIIDANSPENELPTISRYMRDFPNIRYVRSPYRIGIYEAWNLGVTLASGLYLTNTNLDDARRGDSFELQAGVLEQLPFVDIVYQDLFYSFSSDMPFSQVAARGFCSSLPVITSQNLIVHNMPHNAPMWRRRVHDDVGMFDVGYSSAGDFDFWLRCKRKNKVFFKINEPHVVYYVNPDGISTRPNTRGVAEAQRITRTHARALISPHLTSTTDDYCSEVRKTMPSARDVLPGEPLMKDWRYTTAQLAMRQLSRSFRMPAN